MARPAIEFAKKHLKDIDTVVEVGVLGGGHAFSIYETLHPKKMYLVDAYKTVNDDGIDIHFTAEEHARWYREAHKSIWNIPECHFILKRSQIACAYVPDNLDLIYIDASHDEIDVVRDIACWYPKLKIGGILCGHDYNRKDMNSVAKAVHRFFKFEDVGTGEVDWWTIKKGKYYD